MTTMLRFLLIFTLGTWVGAGLFVTIVVAQAAFRQLPTPDLAGAVVGYTLTRLHLMGLTAGIIFLLATAALGGSANLARPAAVLVVLMIALTAASEFGVTPRMASLREQMVAAHGSALEGSARGVRSLEDGFQSLRPVVQERQVGEVVRRAADGYRRRVA